VKDPLLSKFGYFALYCKTYDTEALTKDLGKIFYADTTYKRYPCCSENTAALDCALNLIREEEIPPEEVEEVRVLVPRKCVNPWSFSPLRSARFLP